MITFSHIGRQPLTALCLVAYFLCVYERVGVIPHLSGSKTDLELPEFQQA